MAKRGKANDAKARQLEAAAQRVEANLRKRALATADPSAVKHALDVGSSWKPRPKPAPPVPVFVRHEC